MKKYLILLSGLFLLTGCESNELVGEYVADGTQDVLITEDGPKENVEAYNLELKKDNTFVLEAGEDTITGEYQVSENKVTMQQDDGTVWACDIDEDNNLNCDLYASQFVKQK